MSRYILYILRCLVSCACFAEVALADESAKELLLLTHEFPPYTFTQDNEFVGINTEIISEVLTEENVAFRIESINWARAQRIVETTPNTALLAAGRSKVRENKYAWIGPLVSSSSYLFKLASRKDIVINSLSDLELYRIVLVRRGVMVDTFEEMGLTAPDNLILISNASDRYKILFQKRADLLLGSDLTTPYNVRNAGYDLSAIEPVIELETNGVANHLAVNKDLSPELIEKCNQRIKALWETGYIAQVIERYRLQ